MKEMCISFLNGLLLQRAIQENLPSTAISVFLGGERKALEDRERRIERSLPSNITKQVSVSKRSQNSFCTCNRFLYGFHEYEKMYSKTHKQSAMGQVILIFYKIHNSPYLISYAILR